METVSISDIENVVRFISHLHKDGTINPKSFKLRQWPEPKGPERYISVNRYESASLVADLQAYDKRRRKRKDSLPFSHQTRVGGYCCEITRKRQFAL